MYSISIDEVFPEMGSFNDLSFQGVTLINHIHVLPIDIHVCAQTVLYGSPNSPLSENIQILSAVQDFIYFYHWSL